MRFITSEGIKYLPVGLKGYKGYIHEGFQKPWLCICLKRREKCIKNIARLFKNKHDRLFLEKKKKLEVRKFELLNVNVLLRNTKRCRPIQLQDF